MSCPGPALDLDSLDISECARRLYLAAVLPLSIVLVVSCKDILQHTQWRRKRLGLRPWAGAEELLADTKTAADGIVPVASASERKRQTLAVSSGLGALAYFAAAALDSAHHLGLPPLHVVTGLAWLFSSVRLFRLRLDSPPYGLLALLLALALNELAAIRHSSGLSFHLALTALAAAGLTLISSLPLQPVKPSSRVAMPGHKPTDQMSTPEDALSLRQYCTISWIGPILRIAKRRQLDFSDIWQRSPYMQARNLSAQFDRIKSKSLLWHLVCINAYDITIELVARFSSIIFSFAGPFLLSRTLTAFGSRNPQERQLGYSLAFLALLADVIRAELEVFASWAARRTYERSRVILVANAHQKALKRQIVASARLNADDDAATDQAASDIGRILNIAQADSWTISQILWDNVTPLLVAPVQIAVASVLLYRFLGWSAFAGVGVFVLAALLQLPIARLQYNVDRNTQRAADKRISSVSEILQSIRLLKALSWEEAWLAKTEAARRSELRFRLRGNILDIASSLLWSLVPALMPLAAFFCMIKIEKRPLTVPIAFPSLALLEMIRTPLSQLPESFIRLVRVFVSIRRVNSYYSEPDLVYPESSDDIEEDYKDTTSAYIGFDTSTFIYPGSRALDGCRQPFELHAPRLRVSTPSLTLICGPTGSGKTSILLALLGELEGGRLIRSSKVGERSIAYAGQSAWLEQATIRDNICRAAPYDPKRFQQVVHACALDPDLRDLTHCDLTEIGERGVSLSGGQKARIALARAVYSHAEIMSTHHEALCGSAASRILRIDHGHINIEERLVDLSAPSTAPVELARKRQTIEQLLDDIVSIEAEPHKLIEEEGREKGAVKWDVYRLFVKSSGVWLWTAVALALVGEQAVEVALRWFLKIWSEGGARSAGPARRLPSPNVDADPWLLTYFVILVIGRLILTTRNILAVAGAYQAAKVLFSTCLAHVVRARTRWFDTTPIGRISNRLTNDVGIADKELSMALRNFLATLLSFLTSIGVVIWLVPAFAPAAILLLLAYWRLAKGFRCAYRDIRRLEFVAWSPLFQSFGEMLHGLVHIRAFGLSSAFQDRLFSIVDLAEACDHYKWAVGFWIRLRFDLLSALALFFVTVLAFRSGVDQGFAAFAILTAKTFVNALHEIIWNFSNLEKDLAAVERLDEFLHLDVEKLNGDSSTELPPAGWPSSTNEGLVYENVVFTYAAELEPALKSVSLRFGPTEKIGIVGRTGSGKSSLGNALLRVSEPTSGRILLDGVDTQTVSLRKLRSHITTVPQDALLFKGTLRTNLDPFGQYTDADLLAIMSRVGLTHWALDDHLDASGSGSSAGERQLVALARTFLRKSKVVILDESTASVDVGMDRRLQKVIREELADALVLTIAHRIETVSDYDRIIVMSRGEVLEQGPPAELLRQANSAFYALCAKSGKLDELRSIAEEAERSRQTSSA